MTRTQIIGKHSHYLTGASKGFTYKQEHWVFQRAGLITNYHVCDGLTLQRCTIDGSMSREQCWGIRAYDVRNAVIEGCEFINIVGPHPTKPINVGEHGPYLNVIGDVTIRNCTFDNISGQGVQTVFYNRTKESSDYERFKDAGGLILVERCNLNNVGLANPNHTPGGRASFPLSFFPSSQNVMVKGCKIINEGGEWWSKDPADPAKPRFRAYGGIMANGHPKVQLINNHVSLDAPDRDLVQAYDVDNFEMSGGSYNATGGNGAKVNLRNVKRIRIEKGIKSNAQLRVDGKVVGMLRDGYSRG